ncbi:hypothetical protein PGTUg99_012771 [Puccinia graminis f. sp. tritici]|uniref:Uncharacterized protein n=1 Tax=Puccinia graminis f. sp. tritici TaxID=56615 RepID=A0A5B0S4D2_PUCGR|nr:hypothetical protein PGTUg99_012771 [Puccinia graminis f. sp. tritici]
MFAPLPNEDTTMADQTTVSTSSDSDLDKVCSDLQAKLKLDPENLEIALLTSKCTPAAQHTNAIFAQAAFIQLALRPNSVTSAPHVFDDRFRDFVRAHARMILLKPTLEAYSNNPHRNGALPQTLYYLTLDAIDQQSDDWKEDHLAPGQLQDDPVALEAYREALLTNILETQRISIKGSVPNCHEMLTAIYEELPPRGEKMTAAKIRTQVERNWAMRIRMSYARLVMVHYYVHKSRKTSQWLEIDERLGILRGSLVDFQRHHAQLVLDKDNELFSHLKRFDKINKEDFTVPSLEDVRKSMAATALNNEATAATLNNTQAVNGD